MTFRLSNYRNLKKQQQIFSYCQIEDRIVVDQLLMMSRYRDEQPLNVSFDLMKIAVEHVKEIIFFSHQNYYQNIVFFYHRVPL